MTTDKQSRAEAIERALRGADSCIAMLVAEIVGLDDHDPSIPATAELCRRKIVEALALPTPDRRVAERRTGISRSRYQNMRSSRYGESNYMGHGAADRRKP